MVARITRGGIAVRKVATPHRSEAVAVYFNIRSNRDDRCTVRIADAIPQSLRGNDVEFHPRYDPANWNRADGTVLYTSTILPDADRTTVYGVVVDDQDQLDLFSAEPAVEVEANGAADSTADGSDGGSFSFGPSDDAASSTTDPAGEDLAASDSEPVSTTDSTGRAGRAADVDRIESQVEALSASLDRRHASLADDVEELEAALDREARWRSQLLDSLEYEPGTER